MNDFSVGWKAIERKCWNSDNKLSSATCAWQIYGLILYSEKCDQWLASLRQFLVVTKYFYVSPSKERCKFESENVKSRWF